MQIVAAAIHESCTNTRIFVAPFVDGRRPIPTRVPAGHGPQGRMQRAIFYHMCRVSVYLDRGQGTEDRVLLERTPGDTKPEAADPEVRVVPVTGRAPHVCSAVVP